MSTIETGSGQTDNETSPHGEFSVSISENQGERDRSPLVTVIIPTFNRGTLILETLESIRSQSYRPLEIVIVDDGSTDDTMGIIASWKAGSEREDFQIVYAVQQNQGASAARNLGLSLSRGQFIQFMDSDDLLLPQKIEREVSAYQTLPAPDLVYSSWLVDSNGVRRLMPGPDLEADCSVSSVVLNYLCTFAPLYRRRTLEQIGGWNSRLLCSQDRDICTRTVSVISAARRITSPGGIYRLHHSASSISSSRTSKHIVSAWETNNMMTRHVLTDHSQLRQKALQALAHRKLKNAAEAVACRDKTLALRILFSDRRIWTSGLTHLKSALRILVNCFASPFSRT